LTIHLSQSTKSFSFRPQVNKKKTPDNHKLPSFLKKIWTLFSTISWRYERGNQKP